MEKHSTEKRSESRKDTHDAVKTKNKPKENFKHLQFKVEKSVWLPETNKTLKYISVLGIPLPIPLIDSPNSWNFNKRILKLQKFIDTVIVKDTCQEKLRSFEIISEMEKRLGLANSCEFSAEKTQTGLSRSIYQDTGESTPKALIWPEDFSEIIGIKIISGLDSDSPEIIHYKEYRKSLAEMKDSPYPIRNNFMEDFTKWMNNLREEAQKNKTK